MRHACPRRVRPLRAGGAPSIPSPRVLEYTAFSRGHAREQALSATQNNQKGESIPQTGALGSRILLAEDNRSVADSMAMVLELHGHEVRTVEDGESALKLAQSPYSPHMVLIDIGLPGIDGYEVARRLRASTSPESHLLVAITGYGQASDRARALEAGFDHYLVKPVNAMDLLDLLDAWLPSDVGRVPVNRL